jgi:serine-type D-Ala-D-Ala carboxypeptidase/endopeptidase (penicillin-binding protein 4)
MLRLFLLVISMLSFGNSALCADSFVPRLSLPRDARWALVAVELKTGKELVRAGNALAEPLTPGSLVKLFTAGAVLDRRERRGAPDLTTTILHDGEIRDGVLYGNLYIVGRGNDFLSPADLKDAVRKIADQRIRRITGNVIADDTFFDTKGLERSRTGSGHTPAGALGLDLHTAAVIVTPTGQAKPPLVMVEPPLAAVRLAVEARTTATATSSIKVVQLDDTSYRVTGNISADSGPLKWRFSLHDPALYAAEALKACLKLAGIQAEGNGKKGKTPTNATLLTKIVGPELQNLVRDMNVNSLNVMADNLLLSLGATRYGAPGTRDKGLKAVNEFLGVLDLPHGEMVIADGSGLRDENRMTAGYMAHYLRGVSKKSWFPAFRDSLPRAGLDGTLRNIGYRNERFRVKSGRLENAFALAGYGVDGMGRVIAFAYIVNVSAGGAGMNLELSGAEVMKYLGTEVLQ